MINPPTGRPRLNPPRCKDRASFWQLSHELGIDVARLRSMAASGLLEPVGTTRHGLTLFDRQKATAVLRAIGAILD